MSRLPALQPVPARSRWRWRAGPLLGALVAVVGAGVAQAAAPDDAARRREVDAAVDPVWPRSPQEVARVLAIHGFRQTQQQVLARHPGAPERVVVDIVIGADGRVLGCVGSASSPGLPAPLVQALCEPLRSMYFGRKPADSPPVGQPLVIREAPASASASGTVR